MARGGAELWRPASKAEVEAVKAVSAEAQTADADPVSTGAAQMSDKDVLTKAERGVMWQHRILNVAWELKFGMSSSRYGMPQSEALILLLCAAYRCTRFFYAL